MIGKLPKLTLWQFGNVPVRVDISLPLLPVFILILFSHRSPTDLWPFIVAFTLALIVTVVLHELGHALVAKHYKLGIKEFVIGGLWGYVRLKRQAIPRIWYIIVLVAGPLVNLIVFAVLALAFSTPGTVSSLPGVSDYIDGGLSEWSLSTIKLFAFFNLITFAVNILPIYPMDGGRIAHQLLGWFLSPQYNAFTTAVLGILTSAACIYFGADYGTIWIGFFLFMIFTNMRLLTRSIIHRPRKKN